MQIIVRPFCLMLILMLALESRCLTVVLGWVLIWRTRSSNQYGNIAPIPSKISYTHRNNTMVLFSSTSYNENFSPLLSLAWRNFLFVPKIFVTWSGVIEASLTRLMGSVSEMVPNPPMRYEPDVLRAAVTSSCPVLPFVSRTWWGLDPDTTPLAGIEPRSPWLLDQLSRSDQEIN